MTLSICLGVLSLAVNVPKFGWYMLPVRRGTVLKSNHRANSDLRCHQYCTSSATSRSPLVSPHLPRCRSSVYCQDIRTLVTWMRRARCTPPPRRRRSIGAQASGDFAVHLVESVAGVGRQCDAEVHFSSHESGLQAVGYRNKNSGTDPVSVCSGLGQT
jgi:hypothetical protein